MRDEEIFLLILVVAFVCLFGGTGLWLVMAGRPRRRGYPACGVCVADVTGAVEGGVCPACGRSFATAGVDPPRRKTRPALLAVGIVFLSIALYIVAVVVPAML